MKRIIAFAGSNSKQSINKMLVEYTRKQVEESGLEVIILDLNDFEMPIFGVDLESRDGYPESAKNLFNYIKNCDGIILSLAEHNGAYSTVFKNAFDWMSRIEAKLFAKKPMLLMATSSGGRGGASVLAIAKDRFPRHDAHIVADFSLPMFNTHFKNGEIIEELLKTEFKNKVELFKNEIKNGD
ncbi:NADPH-dependent oxidoreductase [Bizionia argentinensis JUB59]|uniref:NADPH-dependent oxidoreductase n=1 Tax=Bizionia argentinensis JUB59 TaxID=1046627 RepID=G2E9U7_9FLAO|nr:NAD(P)H-dependent oxidoreductase [Bizionia argentinensis]EGV45076.1 NADPH-dependent oxidoreductase [Bizionia argentinensis JUB59]